MPKTGTERLEPKNFILREYEDPEYDQKILDLQRQVIELQELSSQIKNRSLLLWTLTVVFGGCLFFSLVIVLLHGFKVAGFSLDVTTMNILVTGTLGELAGLLAVGYGALFRK
jgi:hypothetical protein